MSVSRMSPSYHVHVKPLFFGLAVLVPRNSLAFGHEAHHFLSWLPAWTNTHFNTENISLCQINTVIIIWKGDGPTFQSVSPPPASLTLDKALSNLESEFLQVPAI